MEQQNKEKISDKAFARLILTSVLGILVCIVCLSASTYAWFTDGEIGASNKIQSASECLFSALVYTNDTDELVATVDTQNPITLKIKGDYTVTLTLPSGSASGYLVVRVGSQEYYSDYLQRNDSTNQTLTFTLKADTETSVTLFARWGIYSDESDVQNGTLHIS